MALKPCPRCGKMISDKAERCPQCGLDVMNINSAQNPQNQQPKSRPTIIDKPLPQGQPTIIEKPSQDEYTTLIEQPKKSKKGLWICLCIILAIGIGAAIWIPVHRHNEKLRAEHIALLEQQRLDSIAAVEAELARLEQIRQDSIRQDSIFRNFKSIDLEIFELHGRVKSVSGSSPLAYIFDYTNPNIHYFDEDGNCKKDKFVQGFKYDTNGYYTEVIYNDDSGGYPRANFKWKDGKLIEYYDGYGNHNTTVEYKYDNNGDLIQSRQKDIANSDYNSDEISIYTILERDEWGNWTKRKIVSNKVESWSELNDDADGGWETKENKEKTSNIETRKIVYY